jgi:hypothetical protein
MTGDRSQHRALLITYFTFFNLEGGGKMLGCQRLPDVKAHKTALLSVNFACFPASSHYSEKIGHLV